MTNNELSELLTTLLQRLSQGESIDIRHDQMYPLKVVLARLDISKPTLMKAIRSGEFPEPTVVCGQDRWPSYAINQYLWKKTPHIQKTEELRQQAAQALAQENS
ncbi:hypothetical protein [Endozoicomonas lisbonensis]|uniref:DNA-binding transcriptional regulator AlpA n=1 Tax=Endozoicomonas lisbonensis TaxID=3120522 RepID=A0ABV2SGT4_9GAMM